MRLRSKLQQMTMQIWIGVLTLGCLMMMDLPSQAQSTDFVLPTTNPRAVVQQRVASTEIEVTYHRPSVRDRQIFGALVPYDQVWRTGADSATKISLSTPVTLNGTPIDAGTYEIFTIPNEEMWTVIIQQNQSQWGSYRYDPAHDVARIAVTPFSLRDPVESFTISFANVTRNTAKMNIAWDRTQVSLTIGIDVRATVVPHLEAALQAEGRRPYFLGAMFYFENDLDINRAAELMALALESNPGHIGMLYRQALILERKGDRAGAIAAAERSLNGATSASHELREEYTRLNTALLNRLRQ